jgi:oligoribonuclease
MDPRDRVERVQTPGNLAWIDLEMTGLDPNQDVILQAALIVTNANLEPLEEFACDIWQPSSTLETMVPFVREMHQRTGLLERVKSSHHDLKWAEKALLERVAGWCPFPAILCGNTIGQDRRFIDRWMPGLNGYLHYRMLDVTSLKLVANLWYGDQAVFKKSDAGAHDALVDIKNSIAELAYYRSTILRS